jgi:hypothetical protein
MLQVHSAGNECTSSPIDSLTGRPNRTKLNEHMERCSPTFPLQDKQFAAVLDPTTSSWSTTRWATRHDRC